MTLELTYDSFSDSGLASGDPDGRPPRPNRHVWIDGRDVVYLEEVPADRDGCAFTLETAGGLGWKGLRFVGRDGRVLAEVEGQGTFTVGCGDLDGGRLVFVRGDELGTRSDAYHLAATGLRDRKVDTGYGGLKRVGELRFRWTRDSR